VDWISLHLPTIIQLQATEITDEIRQLELLREANRILPEEQNRLREYRRYSKKY
jgi:hypothetical protein